MQDILFRLWSRTISGIKNNFRGMYIDNISCPLCPDSHIDTILNRVICPTIQSHIQSRGLYTSHLEYKNILSSDTMKQQNEKNHIYAEVRKQVRDSDAKYTKINWCHVYLAYNTLWNQGYQVVPGEEKTHSSGLTLNNLDILVPKYSSIHSSPVIFNVQLKPL